MVKLAHASFREADADGSGALDKTELAQVIRSLYKAEGILRSQKLVDEEVSKAMLDFDANSSGTLDETEFVKMFQHSSAFKFKCLQLDSALSSEHQIRLVRASHQIMLAVMWLWSPPPAWRARGVFLQLKNNHLIATSAPHRMRAAEAVGRVAELEAQLSDALRTGERFKQLNARSNARLQSLEKQVGMDRIRLILDHMRGSELVLVLRSHLRRWQLQARAVEHVTSPREHSMAMTTSGVVCPSNAETMLRSNSTKSKGSRRGCSMTVGSTGTDGFGPLSRRALYAAIQAELGEL